MFGRKHLKLATVLLLTLTLIVALAPAAFAQEIVGGTQLPPPVNNPASSGNGNTGNTPPPMNTGSGGNGETTTPPETGNTGSGEVTMPPETGNGGGSTMPAPSWPPANMIVTHAATQVQLAPVGDGLQAYFIGSDGTGHPGPYIDSFSNLASLHSAGVAALYTGSNQGTGKPVTIYYLASENRIRISTFYPDTQYDTNKPYVFTVDSGHNVVHEQW